MASHSVPAGMLETLRTELLLRAPNQQVRPRWAQFPFAFSDLARN